MELSFAAGITGMSNEESEGAAFLQEVILLDARLLPACRNGSRAKAGHVQCSDWNSAECRIRSNKNAYDRNYYVACWLCAALPFCSKPCGFFHELEHFLIGRWCDVKVEIFSPGFGGIADCASSEAASKQWLRFDR
jgi:hypothetical protein